MSTNWLPLAVHHNRSRQINVLDARKAQTNNIKKDTLQSNL